MVEVKFKENPHSHEPQKYTFEETVDAIRRFNLSFTEVRDDLINRYGDSCQINLLARGSFAAILTLDENRVVKFFRATDKGYTTFLKFIKENGSKYLTALPKIYDIIEYGETLAVVTELLHVQPKPYNDMYDFVGWSGNRVLDKVKNDLGFTNGVEFSGLVNDMKEYQQAHNENFSNSTVWNDLHRFNMMVRPINAEEFEYVVTDPWS